MTALSVRFSRALAKGRRTPAPPPTRGQLLHILLRKRAAAHQAGAEDLEALLRDQIRWSLPVEKEPETIVAPAEAGAALGTNTAS